MLKEGMIKPDNQKAAVANMANDHISERVDHHHSVDIRRIIAFVGATYFLFMTAWIVPVACVLTVAVFIPLMFINMPLFNFLEHKLCSMVNAHWNACAAFCGTQITEYGQNLAVFAEEKCLFLANHLGLLDHFVLMQSLNEKGSVRSKWMWVIYNIWKYTPLGVMWTTHGNFFVNGGASKREKVLSSFKKHIENRFYKHDYGWIVMYPEGSRLFLVKNSAQQFAKKNGLKALTNCVYPRTGAAHAVLQVLGPKEDDAKMSNCGKGEPIKYIIDATIGYHGGVVPNLGDALMGEWPTIYSPQFAVHYEVFPVKAEWADEEKLKEFLYERYEKKDKLLGEFYKTGSFPGEKRKLIANTFEMFYSQIFWMALYYIHYTIWLRPLMIVAWNWFSSLVF